MKSSQRRLPDWFWKTKQKWDRRDYWICKHGRMARRSFEYRMWNDYPPVQNEKHQTSARYFCDTIARRKSERQNREEARVKRLAALMGIPKFSLYPSLGNRPTYSTKSQMIYFEPWPEWDDSDDDTEVPRRRIIWRTTERC